MTQKIVINTCYGGFGLSDEAIEWLEENYPEVGDMGYLTFDIPRDHEGLVEVVERMGDNASGTYADLEVVEIPDGVEWTIDEYDGWESVEEKHRSWG